ncbi:MAG: M48 family metallopeptidase [Gammaproteobacteria bacterium]|nr:M48 family metallopeptidase [Gammaproteobacteria bacterium]
MRGEYQEDKIYFSTEKPQPTTPKSKVGRVFMNFFDNQEKARKYTFWLILYFILAIAFIILVIDCIVMGAVIYVNPQLYYSFVDSSLQLNQPALINLALLTTASVSPTIILVIVIGTIYKIISLREGGIAVANMVGAREIDPGTTDFLEKRFMNVVEEMSIASGISIPKLYIMDNELAINAFVAGVKPEDTVMVVTKGALHELSRDELQGVIGHEFSHIFNSDMQISLKLMGVLGGLLIIGQAGYFLLRILSSSNRRSRSSSKDDGRLLIALVILGVGLLVVGYVGLFFGRLIKSAVSRQRELLADASSVQYTRNPQGIIFALRRIQQSASGTKLATRHVEDISHLCFCTPRRILFSDLLATHPPLEKRIQILDPRGEYASLPLKDLKIDKQEDIKKNTSEAALGIIGTAAVIASTQGQALTKDIKSSIGNPSQSNVNLAQAIISQIPQELIDIAHSMQQVEIIFYAFLLNANEEKIAPLINFLKTTLNEDSQNQTEIVRKMIADLSKTTYLPLVDIALLAFKANSVDERRRVCHNIQQLISLGQENLFEFALLALISNSVEEKPSIIKYNDFNPVINEVSILIWALVKNNQLDKESQHALFDKLMQNFTSRKVQPPELSTEEPLKFQTILSKLNQLSPKCKEILIDACLDCITKDNVVNVTEAEMVRAIAASINCPIPPIVATQ